MRLPDLSEDEDHSAIDQFAHTVITSGVHVLTGPPCSLCYNGKGCICVDAACMLVQEGKGWRGGGGVLDILRLGRGHADKNDDSG